MVEWEKKKRLKIEIYKEEGKVLGSATRELSGPVTTFDIKKLRKALQTVFIL